MNLLNQKAVIKSVKIIFYSIFFSFLGSFSVSVQAQGLPSPVEVQSIWIQPQDGKLRKFYTPESLFKALPHLHRANFKSLGFGKVWLWQKGIIYLKNGKEIHWRSFTDNIILIDTDDGPVLYTDIQSQSHNFADGKITRIINTWEGPKEVIIDMR